ncbi:MAG: arylsulfatase [Armatimonadota bacterium]
MSTTADRPNIIWIMADDLSWADMGCFGQKKIQTPNLDRLADEGMTFTGCHSGSSLCAPSRSSLMQGLHQGHATVRNNMVPGGYRHSLQPDDTTVAQVLNDAGYATGLFGKWGLAVQDQPGLPTNMGFDDFCGYLNQRRAHNYYPPYLWRNTEKIEFPQHIGHDHTAPDEYVDGKIRPNGMEDPDAARYSFDVYTEASEQWLAEHHEEAFFMYLAYTIPHLALEVPNLAPYTDLDWPKEHRIYAAMVTRMDTAVGRLLDMLDEYGVADNTLLFFTSDNGYSMEKATQDPTLDEFFDHRGPYRGTKGTMLQGGLRVPTLARWPGVIEAGSSSDLPWAYYDFLPTAADVAGAETPDETDGLSIAPTLKGESDQPEHEFMYWELVDEQAVRLDDYYAYRSHPDEPVEVYLAEEDPDQERDLADTLPTVVARAEQLMADEHDPTPYFPSPGQGAENWQAELVVRGIDLPRNVDL